MNEPGIPSRTGIASKTKRLAHLLGPGYSVIVEHKYEPNWYEVSATKDGQYANWYMLEIDFDYTDDELIEKFINPAKGVFK